MINASWVLLFQRFLPILLLSLSSSVLPLYCVIYSAPVMHLSIAACVSFSLHQSKTDSSTSCSNKNSFSVCHPHKLSVGKNRRIGENWNFKYNICQWDAHRDCLLADYTIHTIPYRRETSGVGCNKECCRVDEGKLRYLSWLWLRSEYSGKCKAGKSVFLIIWTLLCATVSHPRHPPHFMRDIISLYHHPQQKHCKRL